MERQVRGHHEAGFSFHALRRMWATERMHLPVRDVAYVGGWKGTQTPERVYHRPELDTMQEVVMSGRRIRAAQGG